MNRLFLSTSFASIGFLPLASQAPTKPSPAPVVQAVIVTPVAPDAPAPDVAPVAPEAPEAPAVGVVEWLLAPKDNPTDPQIVEGWVLSAGTDTVEEWGVSPETGELTLYSAPIASKHGGVVSIVGEVTAQGDENAQLRTRLNELEAQMEALLKSQEKSQGGEWRTIHESEEHERSAPSPSQPHRVHVRKVIESPGEAPHTEENSHYIFADESLEALVLRSGPNSQGNLRFFHNGQGQGETRKFPAGTVKLRSNQWPSPDHDVRVWTTGQSRDFFQLHGEDCEDCEEECENACEEECENACEDERTTHRRFIGIGSGPCDFEDVDFEELEFDLEELNLGELNFDMSNLDLSELHINLEDLDLNLEDLDIEELIGSGTFDDNKVIIQLGFAGAGPHGQSAAPQPDVIVKRFVGGTRSIGHQSGSNAPPAGAPSAPRSFPTRPTGRVVRTGAPSPPGRHRVEHDAHGEWASILEEMHDELRELRDVIGDLSQELREISRERQEGRKRKSMR